MFRNFITIAFRILFRHKAFSFINISGLAIGLASAVLILLYVQDELGYDRFYRNYDQIYRVGLHSAKEGNERKIAVSCVPLAPTLALDFPEVVSATRVFTFIGEPIVKYNESSFPEEKFFYADSGFFGEFETGLLRGDPETALSRPNTVVITDEMAGKYFGKEDPTGKVIEVWVEPGILPFLMASLVALLIAVLTVGLRAYIAAKANPADSLRYEYIVYVDNL